MADYDDIVIPVQGQPISSASFGKKVRDYIIDLGARMSIREAAELLPASIGVTGGGVNTLAGGANVYTTFPSFPVSAIMTNPSTTFKLVVNVFFGCWMQTSAGDVRMGIALSGGLTISSPTIGANQPSGHGNYPFTQSTTSDQHMGFMQVTIPPSVAAVTFTGMGARSNAAATANVNYPTINIVPDRYTL
jgi:hypothetical protein